ncbi:hypothetical protein GJM87_20515 [Vibrio parahaemolyticus]|nr:hypothetical protein [Vibrio parahaemolyticus]EGQ8948378.1 hypothetical protein [Vibrio parahaemolyticus]EGQ8967527.1 hypothetical protein [Vibrio parahaemolyticus]
MQRTMVIMNAHLIAILRAASHTFVMRPQGKLRAICITNCLRVIRNAWHFHYALV